MALIRSKPIKLQPAGLSDAVDGTNAFPGAMQVLQNLIPSPATKYQWVPRPGSQTLTSFGGFTTPGFISALLTVGVIGYGMISSGLNAGKDQPFAYNFVTNTFLTVNGITPSNVPTSPATSGDWTPPILAQVASRIIVCHPGFDGATHFFGWFDVSGFSSTSITGTVTNGSAVISALSSNVLQAGWQVGMTISGTNIPTGAVISSIASNGLSLTFSASAFPSGGGTGVALTVAGGTATAPLWGSGQMNGAIAFTGLPVAVAQFNGRAYFACSAAMAALGVSVLFSDSGSPCQTTNATQGLAFRNGLPVTAIAPLPLNSPLTGGQTQAILAFQGDNQIQQITGDPTTNNLATNAIDVATGTLSPLSICPTTKGLLFAAPDGVRMIGFDATVSNPIGANGQGVCVPFINALHPSRTCASFNQNVYRISVQNAYAPSSAVQEYWYDFNQQIWSGPHTFPASQIQPMQGPANSFIMAASGINAKLWQSDVLPVPTDLYTENGSPLSFIFQTCLLPDNDEMAMNAIVESSFALNVGGSLPITVLFLDESGNTIDTVSIAGSQGTQTIWGVSTWGAPTVWGGSNPSFFQKRLNWHKPIVFKQGSLRISGTSQASLVLGNIYLKYQILGYQLQTAN